MDNDEVRALYDAVIAGWNAHSGEQMAAPFVVKVRDVRRGGTDAAVLRAIGG